MEKEQNNFKERGGREGGRKGEGWIEREERRKGGREGRRER